jgi:N,N-dimethylformamidase
VTIVRLIHADTNPIGPGFKCEMIETLGPVVAAKVQPICAGSYVRLAAAPAVEEFALSLWIMPTLPGPADQGIFACPDAGIALTIDAEGRIVWTAGGTSLRSSPVRIGRWTRIEVAMATSGRVTLSTTPRDFDPADAAAGQEGPGRGAPLSGLLLLGALAEDATYRPRGCFNGRIGGVHLRGPDDETLLHWSFGEAVGSRTAVDLSAHGRHGEVVNRPTRGVKGPHWSGHVSHFEADPAEYDAIHFHADDLEDCRWEESAAYAVPADLPSGIYAAEIRSARDLRYLPFAVTPAPGLCASSVAVLLPTLSYLAYSNEALDPDQMPALCPLRDPHAQAEDYAYIAANGINSLYDRHADGTGRCMATSRRPNLTSFDPMHRSRLFNAPHQLGADLHLIDWLEAKGIAYDVITDHELHAIGVDRLAGYRAVLTGTHAEYWTTPMLDALARYQQGGGRFVYLSGNGLYWVTALDDSGTVAEIRRFGGTESWTAAGGEVAISLTGEQGGLWKDRGRAPQTFTGVGMAAQGFDRGTAYRRRQESYDARAAFIFAGVEGELIGDHPALVMTHGAAGYEVDRVDDALGTPAHALWLASSVFLSDSYQFVRESAGLTNPYDGGIQNPQVRADMVYYELPNGGAVFSVGSISFCSTLFWNGYDNSVSRVLENVVTAFGSAEWSPSPASNSSTDQEDRVTTQRTRAHA